MGGFRYRVWIRVTFGCCIHALKRLEDDDPGEPTGPLVAPVPGVLADGVQQPDSPQRPAPTSPEAHGHGKILGGGMVGTHAGDMIGEIALAIEMGADAVDIGKTIHPHPTLGESIGMAAEVAHGSCTDVPPARK